MWKRKNDYKKELKEKALAGKLTQEEEAEYKKLKGFPLKKLFANKRTAITTLGLIIMCFIQNFGYYGIFSWMPTVLSQKYGYSLAKASGWLLISTIGMFIGTAVFGIMADKIGRKKTFSFYYIGGTIYCFLYFFVIKDPNMLLWGSSILGFFANGMMGGFGAVLAENYPSEARSTAENFIFGIKPDQPDIIPPFRDGEVLDIFVEVAKTGKMLAIHAENHDILEHLTRKIEESGRRDYEAMLEGRPNLTEETTVQTGISFARTTGARLHILHISTAEGVERVHNAQKEGLPITAETCPHYLFLSNEDYSNIGPAMKVYPLVKYKKDQEAIWKEWMKE
jgi:hypothetical protein